MTDPDVQSQPNDLEQRLRAARAREDARRGVGPRRQAQSSHGMAAGFRIVVEILAALAIGVGIGLVLDQWFGTGPVMLIVFFFLGCGAAFVNVVRAAKDMDKRARAERAAREEREGE